MRCTVGVVLLWASAAEAACSAALIQLCASSQSAGVHASRAACTRCVRNNLELLTSAGGTWPCVIGDSDCKTVANDPAKPETCAVKVAPAGDCEADGEAKAPKKPGCAVKDMTDFCELAPKVAAPGPTPVPEHNVCSLANIKAEWATWKAYCALPAPKSLATNSDCTKLVDSSHLTDPARDAIDKCSAQTGGECYTFDLEGSRCHGGGPTDVFNCKEIPTAMDTEWKSYCSAPTPKSWAMTEDCTTAGLDAGDSGEDEGEVKTLKQCEKAVKAKLDTEFADDATKVKTCTCAQVVAVKNGEPVCAGETGKGKADGPCYTLCSTGTPEGEVKCKECKEEYCECYVYDANGWKCTEHTVPRPPVKSWKKKHHGKHEKHEQVRAVMGASTPVPTFAWMVGLVAVTVAVAAIVTKVRNSAVSNDADARTYGTIAA